MTAILAVIIISAVIALILLLLLCPVSVYIKFDGEFFFKICYAGIPVYRIKPEKDIKEPESTDEESDSKAEKQGENFFKKLTDKKGFTGAVKETSGFAKAVLHRSKKLLEHLKIRRLELHIIVASDDAAVTAISYGAICTAVYPVIALLCTAARVGLKKINVTSDFNVTNPDFEFSFKAGIPLIFLLTSVFGIFQEYKNFKARNEL